MKIKRFLAKNMRDAIRQVREEQGPDAVILSNRRIDGGVEVVAAVDYDAALMQQALRRPAEAAALPPPPAPVLAPPPAVAARPRAEKPATAKSAIPAPQLPVAIPAAHAPLAPLAAPELVQLRRELGGMKKLLEQQFASLMWKDLREHQPERMGALRAMANLAIDPQITREILDQLPSGDKDADGERARFLPLGLLSRRIPIAKKDLILEGGVIALVGPTGVGKTTTIAKLAARYAERFGVRDIALVSTDHYRVGAQEQLFTYGRLLGVPVHCAANSEELRRTLNKLADRKLVLVDTAGLSPRDGQLAAQFAELHSARAPLQVWLTLPATHQAGDLAEIVRRFAPARPVACVLTKLDEATRIGGALSTVIRHQLPVAYLADGQRVPEDLQQARTDQLVLRATQLARVNPAVPQDGTLALHYGAIHAGA